MRGRPLSQQRWLRRQHADPFVAAASKDGYRSRSAYKLAAIDDRDAFLQRSRRIVDFGAAPGGWLQVAVERAPAARIVALDLQPVTPVGHAVILEGDVFATDMLERVRTALGGPADTVLSDMAPSATGHRATDQLRALALAEAAADAALELLAAEGTLLVKLIRGPGEEALVRKIGETFTDVRRRKPPASRAESSEMFLLARGFRPPATPTPPTAGFAEGPAAL